MLKYVTNQRTRKKNPLTNVFLVVSFPPPPTGFSTTIPGYPRYSVLGDHQAGVYNLKISNASLEDDAEYQCQVGPAKFNSAIRANAKLIVICK